MEGIFKQIDKIKPLYDMTYKVMLFICKLLLVADILITSIAVACRYIPFVTAPAWCEEIVLTLMAYMAVLSAALAIRRGAHIRMTALDSYLPKVVIKALDILNDVFVFGLALVMITVGWKYALKLGSMGSYTSVPFLSRFWLYFPIPVAGVAMVVFEIEAFYNHIKSIVIKEENK